MYFESVWDIAEALSDLTFIFKPETKQAIPNIVRVVEGYDLSKKGIDLRFTFVPRGLFQKPYKIEFGSYIKDFSNGKIDIEAVNTYVLGDFRKLKNCTPELKNISNILDPFCKFKDVWFGAYIIFDDPEGKGKKFILKNAAGDPADCGNFNPESLTTVASLDQKIITWSSHQNEKGYTREVHDSMFHFDLSGELTNRNFFHMNQEWLETSGSFNTSCIVTDRSKTDLRLFSSIRGICGLPDNHLYSHIKPWHEIIFHGILRTSYFSSENGSFWIMVYFGASEYKLNNGTVVCNWTDAIIDEFNCMFSGIKLRLKKPAASHEAYHKKKYERFWIPLNQNKV